MIIDPPIKDLLEHVDCRYSLVLMVSKRARQIVNGSEPMLDADTEKPVSAALMEIDAGFIGYRKAEGSEL